MERFALPDFCPQITQITQIIEVSQITQSRQNMVLAEFEIEPHRGWLPKLSILRFPRK